MLQGFKDFINRGNVVDMAVGIAVGVAFTSLVGALGTYFINPIVAVAGGNNERGFGFHLTDSSATFINIGGLINALIVFIVTMAVIYFAIVVPMGKLRALRKAPEQKEAEDSQEVLLLREIRDSLQQRNSQ